VTTNNDTIIAALEKLDPTVNEYWTNDGLPNVESVRSLAGDNTITRKQITEAAPQFTRANPKLGEQAEPAPEAVETVARNTREERITAIVLELETLDAEIDERTLRRTKLHEEKDVLVEDRERNAPPVLSNIRKYINASHKRSSRASTPSTPLGASMGRRTGHGRSRPVFHQGASQTPRLTPAG